MNSIRGQLDCRHRRHAIALRYGRFLDCDPPVGQALHDPDSRPHSLNPGPDGLRPNGPNAFEYVEQPRFELHGAKMLNALSSQAVFSSRASAITTARSRQSPTAVPNIRFRLT